MSRSEIGQQLERSYLSYNFSADPVLRFALLAVCSKTFIYVQYTRDVNFNFLLIASINSQITFQLS